MPPSRRPPRGTWPDRACMGSDPQGLTPTDGCSLQRVTNRTVQGAERQPFAEGFGIAPGPSIGCGVGIRVPVAPRRRPVGEAGGVERSRDAKNPEYEERCHGRTGVRRVPAQGGRENGGARGGQSDARAAVGAVGRQAWDADCGREGRSGAGSWWRSSSALSAAARRNAPRRDAGGRGAVRRSKRSHRRSSSPARRWPASWPNGRRRPPRHRHQSGGVSCRSDTVAPTASSYGVGPGGSTPPLPRFMAGVRALCASVLDPPGRAADCPRPCTAPHKISQAGERARRSPPTLGQGSPPRSASAPSAASACGRWW